MRRFQDEFLSEAEPENCLQVHLQHFPDQNLEHTHYDIHEHNHHFNKIMNTIIILTKTNFMANFDQGWKQGRTWQVEREASNEIQHLFLQKVKMVIT